MHAEWQDVSAACMGLLSSVYPSDCLHLAQQQSLGVLFLCAFVASAARTHTQTHTHTPIHTLPNGLVIRSQQSILLCHIGRMNKWDIWHLFRPFEMSCVADGDFNRCRNHRRRRSVNQWPHSSFLSFWQRIVAWFSLSRWWHCFHRGTPPVVSLAQPPSTVHPPDLRYWFSTTNSPSEMAKDCCGKDSFSKVLKAWGHSGINPLQSAFKIQ